MSKQPAKSDLKVGDRVEVNFDDTAYAGSITKLNTRSSTAVIHFDDGDDLEISMDEIVKADHSQAHPMGDNGEDDDDEDDTSNVDYSVKPGESVIKRDGKGAAVVVREKDGAYKFNPPTKGRGAHHFPVTWDAKGINFEVWAAPDADDAVFSPNAADLMQRLQHAYKRMVKFTGCWRRTKFTGPDGRGEPVSGYNIDLRAVVAMQDGTEHRYLVESIPYIEHEVGDPRMDMKSLNSDICAAIRKWFFLEVRGDAETIRQLRRRADHPEVTAPSLEWLDRLIVKCHEVRDTSLRAGGERRILIETGNAQDATFTIAMNFTELARALEGRPPSMAAGGSTEAAIRDGASGKRRKKGDDSEPTRPRVSVMAPDPKNVGDLALRIQELNKLAKAGDAGAKAEARKIRATLRKMGHAGGARSAASSDARLKQGV